MTKPLRLTKKAVQLVPNSDMFVGNLAEAYYLAGQKEPRADYLRVAISLAYKDLQVNRECVRQGRLALWYGKRVT